MEKNLRYGALLSVYRALLTDKQAETMEYYYDEDLSLGEIAENTGISRQGVRDFIKRAEEQLDFFEEKIGLCAKMELIGDIEDLAKRIKTARPGADVGRLADKILESVRLFEEK